METAVSNREKAADIRRRLLLGEISYDQAKAEAEPLLETIYEKHKEIAKRHGKKAHKLSFTWLMRQE